MPSRTFSVANTLLDTRLGMRAETTLGDRDIFADNESLVGVEVLPPDQPSIPSDEAIDQPVIIEMPSVTIPRDTGGDNETHYIYVGLRNTTRAVPFNPSTLYRVDANGDYAELGTPTAPVERGKLMSLPLARKNPFTTDDETVLTVQFDNSPPLHLFQDLSSREAVYNSFEVNMLAVGKEYIQFQNYTLLPDGRTVEFRNLLRGRHGTEQSARVPNGTNIDDLHVLNEVVYVYDPQAFIRTQVPLGVTVGYRYTVVARRATTTPANYQRASKNLTFNAARTWAPYTILRSDFVGGFPLGSFVGLSLYVRGRRKYGYVFQDDPPVAIADPTDYLSLFVLYAPFDKALLQSEIATKKYNGAPAVSGVDTRPLSTYIIWHRLLNSNHQLNVDNSTGNNQIPPGFVLWNANPALRSPMWAAAWTGNRDALSTARVTECFFDPLEDYRIDPYQISHYSSLNLENNPLTRPHHNSQGFERGKI